MAQPSDADFARWTAEYLVLRRIHMPTTEQTHYANVAIVSALDYCHIKSWEDLFSQLSKARACRSEMWDKEGRDMSVTHADFITRCFDRYDLMIWWLLTQITYKQLVTGESPPVLLVLNERIEQEMYASEDYMMQMAAAERLWNESVPPTFEVVEDVQE